MSEADWCDWRQLDGAPLRIEDYGVIGDTQTAGLVGIDGSLDWLPLPRFDSGSPFAALLGGPRFGRWSLRPCGEVRRARRRYRGRSLVLETELECDAGVVRLVDFMPIRAEVPDVVRIVEGVRGRVELELELVVRFDYGAVVPWVTRVDGGIRAVAGPDSLFVLSPVELHGEDLTTKARFVVDAGDRVPFTMVWRESHLSLPRLDDPEDALHETSRWWEAWADGHRLHGKHTALVERSLLTLKALTFAPTGGIVAAPTTSLPEQLGGPRNWDYRYCWLRDATLTLTALLHAGHLGEARAWRDWLLRAVAGDPGALQIMYGVAGERRLAEYELDHLPGFAGSRPVRIGNQASTQLQLDVYGELIDALHLSRVVGIDGDPEVWELQLVLLEHLEKVWDQPDEGLWEIRGERQHFVHSKVMAWVAFDRAIDTVERFGLRGPVQRWREAREAIHAEVCERGYDAQRNTFTQFYGSRGLDAALLQLPLVGFLPPDDRRVVGTVEAIEQDLWRDGMLRRYDVGTDQVDGLPGDEGCFLACSFWLVDYYVMAGRRHEAESLFDRLAALANDLGLLSEEYDPVGKRMLGNFPQAFSHVGLVNSAFALAGREAATRRSGTAAGHGSGTDSSRTRADS